MSVPIPGNVDLARPYNSSVARRIVFSRSRKPQQPQEPAPMAHKPALLPTYSNSWAVVVGINKYDYCSPLGFACNDARAVAGALVANFGVPEANVTLLLDGPAAKPALLRAVMGLSSAAVAGDVDRLVIFFAGHGHTATGRRGEVGFLVPADGDCRNPDTLIRWDELTRNADLLPAKHVLFVMDACYGGLAV